MSGIIYQIEHETVFNYSDEIAESVMEVRVYPKQDTYQRCLSFQLRINPHVATHQYLDYLGNVIHHFNIPDLVKELVVLSRAVVEVFPNQIDEDLAVKTNWGSLSQVCTNPSDEIWDMVQPSHFVLPTDLLKQLILELELKKLENPFATVTNINKKLNSYFAYEQNSTKVDSPIDDALTLKAGVCQDFTHVMLAVLRELKIPARYVSGYVYPRLDSADRSSDGATHAWVEVLFPEFGWVGFDPTNGTLAGERHIRVAVGRDYKDVPPTRGLYRGGDTSELTVNVKVTKLDYFQEDAVQDLQQAPPSGVKRSFKHLDYNYRQQQQQQQQQVGNEE